MNPIPLSRSKAAAAAAAALVVLVALSLGGPARRAAAQPGAIAENTAKLLDYANRERSARGIAAITRDSRLDTIAQQWAEWMAANGSPIHNAGRLEQIRSLGYQSEGENIAEKTSPMEANFAHNGWMGSDGHRQNMLDPGFQAAGFGMACSTATGRPRYMAVVNFAGDGNRPAGSGVPPATPHVAGTDAISSVVDCNNDGSSSATTASTAPLPPPNDQQTSTTVASTDVTSTTVALESGPSATSPPPTATTVTTAPLSLDSLPTSDKNLKSPVRSVRPASVSSAAPAVPAPDAPDVDPMFATTTSMVGQVALPNSNLPTEFATPGRPMAVALGGGSSGGTHPVVMALGVGAIGAAGLSVFGLYRRRWV